MKVDLTRSLDSFQAEHLQWRVLEVPSLHYLMVDGHGDPNTASEYAEAIGALYPVAYKIKFTSKQELGRDYVVPPLEALWWASDMDLFTAARDKSQWSWTAMIMVPEWITSDMFDDALAQATAKHGSTRLDGVRFERLDEGRCVQTLHLASYDDEAEALAELHQEFIPSAGLQMTGKHHEIYLNDARKVEAAKLRTILRQPVNSI